MKVKEIFNRKISLTEGLIMIVLYPIYLLIFDYVKHEFITFIMSIIFLLGVKSLYKHGGKEVTDEEGKIYIVRDKQKKLNFKDLFNKIITKINMKRKTFFLLIAFLLFGKVSISQDKLERIMLADSTEMIKSEEIKIGLAGYVQFYWFQYSKDSSNIYLLYTSPLNSNGKVVEIKTDLGRHSLPIVRIATNASDYSMAYIGKDTETYKSLMNSKTVQWISFPLVSNDGKGLEVLVGKNRKTTIESFKSVANAKF